ncbi:MAG TPA: nucleoside hydrolase [Acidimicrobiales bacterium]
MRNDSTASGPVPVIFDTDLGTDVDDAVALAFLALDPRVDLRGVTTVNGNVRRRAELAQGILDLAGRGDVPVGLGAADPLGAPSPTMPVGIVARGPRGAVGADAPTAEDVIVEVLRATTTPVHVCGVGAFTNVASVLTAHPELHEAVAGVHLMGGCLGPYRLVPGGRELPALADYNLNGDPLAAAVCLALPLPLRLVPQDVTNELLLTGDDRAAVAAAGPLGAALEEQMAGWVGFLRTRSEDPDLAHVRLHDPLAVVGLVAPEVETRATLGLALRQAGTPGEARLVEDAHGRPATVVRGADHAALCRELVAAITRRAGGAGRQDQPQPMA